MEFRILGPLEVWHEGQPIPLAGARQRELLAVLLLHAGEVVSADRLMDALWGSDQPAAGGTALRVRVSQLRKSLGPGGHLLVTRAPGYALMLDSEQLDLRQFERALEHADRALAAGLPDVAAEHAGQALALWRGAPLADFTYATFATAAIARLEEMRALALELRIEAELALGRHARVIGELGALVAAHPLRERLWAQLMTALYRDGRQADALAAYREARRHLIGQIGIEPGPALQQLEARILAQDPSLTAGSERAAPVQRRCVLALPGTSVRDGAVGRVAAQLATSAGHELVTVALVERPEDLAKAMSALRDRQDIAGRVAAFTSMAVGTDAVRLASEQEAAVLVIDAPATAGRSGAITGDLRTILADAPCDVVVVAQGDGSAGSPDGPVLVPFAGHEHDWSAAELAAWVAGSRPLRLVGVSGGRGRDASRLLASASLALQRGTGVVAEPVLVDGGPDEIIAAAAGASAIVTGLSERWMREGLGKARLKLARRAPCPVLLVRGGVRPGGLAPPGALTQFSWSSARD